MLIQRNSVNILNSLFSYFRVLSSTNIKFTMVEKGTQKMVIAKKGETLLDVARRFNINLTGACEGNCACSTCHIIFDKNVYNKLPPPKEEEEDMLELAFGLTPTSRLACQVKVDERLDGSKIIIPDVQRNVMIDTLKKDIKSKI